LRCRVEVEVKYPLPDPGALVRRLGELDADFVGDVRQVDTYYELALAGPVSRWLRLRRETDGAAFLTFKSWDPGADPEVMCFDEFETEVTDVDATQKILEALGLSELIVVGKLRRRWRLGDVLIALDFVAGLGSFVEFEYLGADLALASRALSSAVAMVDVHVPLGQRDRRGYPALLLERLAPPAPRHLPRDHGSFSALFAENDP